MTAPRILYLATADARGHLMRAQLLVHALRAEGAAVDVITTSDAGLSFFAEFGITAALLSRHYAVQFDPHQNMLRGATDANVAGYVFHPSRMLRDILRLRAFARGADLIVNDSFHPALLTMGTLPGWRRRIVHVYGSSLRAALETNFVGRVPRPLASLFRSVIAFQIRAARARLEHDFAWTDAVAGARATFQLPTPVALAGANLLPAPTRLAAVYLNPHFRDPALAEALERGIWRAQLAMHAVGEGHAGRAGWLARDPRWIDHAAVSEVIVSAPSMAALSIALVYRRPILLIVTDQPEQRRNAEQAHALGLPHRVVVWKGDGAAFAEETARACAELTAARDMEALGAGTQSARARLQAWTALLLSLAGTRGSQLQQACLPQAVSDA